MTKVTPEMLRKMKEMMVNPFKVVRVNTNEMELVSRTEDGPVIREVYRQGKTTVEVTSRPE